MGRKGVEWVIRKGKPCTSLPLVFIISSDPNLYSMASGTLWNTEYSTGKSHLPWLEVMMVMIFA